ncbi:hypothetical protein [Streptococcus sp. CSL10205-OR2]|uniref:hypothetical protein n=1 Tax=Streptococcus sp. CSL10205-OR2 TaxID=2980558 RepID=UPI0021DA2238|nr:hypothetical protein [Streptococcus sp. CSL10205-OR2]MCU9534049.1 hypothetical protein [Streptococcus sp. CSL10205-OR2]
MTGMLIIIILLCFFGAYLKYTKAFKRQILEQYKAYKLSFFTVMAILLAIIVLSTFTGLRLSVELLFLPFSLGVIVYSNYSIWQDAYFDLNDKNQVYFLISNLVVALLNFSSLLRGAWEIPKILTFLFFFSLGLTTLVKIIKEKKGKNESLGV